MSFAGLSNHDNWSLGATYLAAALIQAPSNGVAQPIAPAIHVVLFNASSPEATLYAAVHNTHSVAHNAALS